MAFKKMTEYNEARYGGFFMLRNDGDYADVIFMYRSIDDVLMADVHYIKSDAYSGYVHCCGRGCPACAANIRVDSKLFIPVYNINEREIQFFDRSVRFEVQLQNEVFNNYPNPSEYIFRITRHGAANDRNTRYEIKAVGRNTGDGKLGSYEELLAATNSTFPDKYSDVCKEFSAVELGQMLNNSGGSGYTAPADLPDYQIKPRVAQDTPEIPVQPVVESVELPESVVDTTESADTTDDVVF